MKPLPLPLRVAAGLAVSTAERVRELPQRLAGLPVTVFSQGLQLSMRMQQHVTELAIKGDGALSALRPVEDTPSWATFDEDLVPDLSVPPASVSTAPASVSTAPASVSTAPASVSTAPASVSTAPAFVDNVTPISVAQVPRPRAQINGRRRDVPDGTEVAAADAGDPWAEEELALARKHQDGEFDSSVDNPAGLSNYDDLTVAQLRARLRRFSVEQLGELLAYERDHAARPSFTGMLSRRIDNVNKAAPDHGDGSTSR